MKIVIDVPEGHMPFVRQQVDLHGPEVRLNFEHFPALLLGRVVGEVTGPADHNRNMDQEWLAVKPL